ncbi:MULTISPECIES: KPN_02809 family neutral zinc metallopeptidase [Gammaproteobacteria]|uniref:KPN_02809 family neutral zinc metallopeptidase n=1 Tax=Gammaproteobacteria TaxID=1236 RepID=UPI001914C198|nr:MULTISPECIES: neutral zinc metallopeptidase [Gammaproteobacteria]MBK5303883.1 neutral zinc metallopeptidase [Bacillus sp. TH86]MBK5323652.1 neutral zinc metallopeptidase [Bacillus sp. TH59]MBK5338602.1 neutral zinc metallopeptidase [Bacillus sp. TH57]MBK5312656.1 neutral zinc metallopeptidase [Pseudomonas sp. TH71]MBK5318150.1 neutral zinc metallopeptidase [Erwinia sp. TH79]
MLWNRARRSDNVNDTREGKDARKTTGKMIGATVAVATLTGAGLYSTVSTTPDDVPTLPDTPPHQSAARVAEDSQLMFIQSVLGDTEDTWKQLFAQTGRHYPEPTLTLFSERVTSACGFANTASGPFYCPTNRQVYLDLEFFRVMAQQFSVIGDFAQSYIIAHEIGHHVQLELGLSAPLEKAQTHRQPVTGDGGLEVRAELQADCLAGVWAHHAQRRLLWLEAGDIDAALQAATVFGDDQLQHAKTNVIRPETFSHGTSAQRVTWFSAGFAAGRIDACDTFAATQL